jgi:hypothetical protein
MTVHAAKGLEFPRCVHRRRGGGDPAARALGRREHGRGGAAPDVRRDHARAAAPDRHVGEVALEVRHARRAQALSRFLYEMRGEKPPKGWRGAERRRKIRERARRRSRAKKRVSHDPPRHFGLLLLGTTPPCASSQKELDLLREERGFRAPSSVVARADESSFAAATGVSDREKGIAMTTDLLPAAGEHRKTLRHGAPRCSS